jgi:uracil phosphoribosyltransferase
MTAPVLPAQIPGFGKNMHVLRRTPYTVKRAINIAANGRRVAQPPSAGRIGHTSSATACNIPTAGVLSKIWRGGARISQGLTCQCVQVSLFTCLRSKDSKQSDFVSATRTLTGLILNEAMSLLPSQPRTVSTPVPGASYSGLTLPDPITDLCVVSILRAADSMADQISRHYPGVPVGKILIQRDEETALPKLFFSKLPKDIPTRLVFLVDPMLATGGSASAAIRVLEEAGVKEEHIVMLSIVAAPEGLQVTVKNVLNE